MQNTKKAKFIVFLLILMWGSIAAGEKILLSALNSFQVLFYLMFFSLLTLGIIILFQIDKIRLIKSYKKRDYVFFMSLGIFGLLAYNLLFILGLNFSSAQESFVINYTWPIWIIILATIILKEKITMRNFLAIFISFIGVLIVATNGKILVFSQEHLLGNLFAFCAAFFYGFFSVMEKKKGYDELTSTFFYFLFATIVSFIIMVIFSDFILPTFKEIIGFFWLGGIATGFSYFLWFKALKIGDTVKLSNFILLTPVASLFYIAILLKESIMFNSVLGLLVILLGILIQQIKPHK